MDGFNVPAFSSTVFGLVLAVASSLAPVHAARPSDQPGSENEPRVIYIGGLLPLQSHTINGDAVNLVELIDQFADERQKKLGRYASIRRFADDGSITEVLTVDLAHARVHAAANPRIRDGDQVALLHEFSDWKNITDWSKRFRKEKYKRVPVLGPTTSGGPPEALKPPSDDEVVHAFETIAPATVRNWNPETDLKLRITKEKIADYSDPPRFYPLIGDAQLHHAHYKITLRFEGEGIGAGVDQTEVIYIDHNHFHMIPGKQ